MVGAVCELSDCCREVRLGAHPLHVGKILEGWNNTDDRFERWEVIVVDHREPDDSLVRLVYWNEHEAGVRP